MLRFAIISRCLGSAALLMGCLAGAATANAATRYVCKSGNDANDGSSWATAKLTVQAGLNSATSGDQVWVAKGTYTENITLVAGVALYGGFAGTEDPATFDLANRDLVAAETILDGNQAGSVVTSPSGATATTRIDGFTVRNGNGTLFYSIARYGGGIFCSQSSPMIANNTITANSGTSIGAGIYCSQSSPMIVNNTITGNSANIGGGIYCKGSSPTITNNTMTRNSANNGGGIYCEYSSPRIANNTITGNNASYAGGGIYCEYSSPTIVNNTITGNGAYYGGGIYCEHSSPTIVNDTIMGNSAYYGGGISSSEGPPSIANTIVAFNSSGIHNRYSIVPVVHHSCVFGNTAYNYSGVTDPTGSNGNISIDPKLAGFAYGNVHIQPDSPCRDAGDDTVVQIGWLDMDGQARIQASHVDIGADESNGTTWPAGPNVIVRVSPEGNDANDGSTWAFAKRTMQAGIDAAAAQGGDVWVKAGTYLERITLLPCAHLYGGFVGTESTRNQRNWARNKTILDGQQGGSVVTARAITTIDGFTIRNGTGTLLSDEVRYGGGIYCNSACPTIANNTITGNSANRGGGIYCRYSFPTINNNTITANIASGSSYPTGGGISCEYSTPTIANSTITGNSASSAGGGVYCYTSPAAIFNTIVAFNNLSGIHASGTGVPVLKYNCVYGNTVYNYLGVVDPTGSNGNISADPLFRSANPGPDASWGTADDVLDDLRLTSASPCIDAGNNADVPPDVADLDGDGNAAEPLPIDLAGRLRFFDAPTVPDTGAGTPPVVDMGAYEYLPPIPADLTDDGYVDGDDLDLFEACATGPAIPYLPAALPEPEPGCTLSIDGNGHIAADFDADGDVDVIDFAVLQRCFSAGNSAAIPNCPG